jgi:hypothetical protein
MRVFRNRQTEVVDASEFLNLLNTCIDKAAKKLGLKTSVEGNDPTQVCRKFWLNDPANCARLVFKNVRRQDEAMRVDFELLPPEDTAESYLQGQQLFTTYLNVCANVAEHLERIRAFFPDSQTR